MKKAAAEKAVLPDELKARFRNFINERSGIYFKDYDLKGLEDAVLERMRLLRFDAGLTYYAYLTSSENKENEFRELLNLLTVNHTYFFRNEAQFKALREKVLPEIIEKKTRGGLRPVIRIWSAGCSSGEEPYTIAMIIRQMAAEFRGWDIQILATDAATNALERAKAGLYGENSLRLVPPELRQKHFSFQSGARLEKKLRLNDEIKQMVSLDYLNLMEDDFPLNLDIVFCRNVFIYFDLSTTLKIINKFYNSLQEEGYFFIGYSESLQFLSDKFRMEDSDQAIYYRRKAAPEVFVPRSIEEQAQEVLADITLAQAEAEEKEFVQPLPAAENISGLLTEAIKLIFSKRFAEALSLVEEAKSKNEPAAEPYYLAAEVFFNQGRFNEAKNELKGCLRQNVFFAPAHYLAGALYLQEAEVEKAKRSFKKALFLDKDFALAYLSLANIYRDQKLAKEAVREYRNTLNVLSKISCDDIIAHSGGFNAATLISVCRDNIERLKAGV